MTLLMTQPRARLGRPGSYCKRPAVPRTSSKTSEFIPAEPGTDQLLYLPRQEFSGIVPPQQGRSYAFAIVSLTKDKQPVSNPAAELTEGPPEPVHLQHIFRRRLMGCSRPKFRAPPPSVRENHFPIQSENFFCSPNSRSQNLFSRKLGKSIFFLLIDWRL